ncbi:uncharacterized protein DUF1232 [Prolixibacter denitrificans]|nr:uncharacterized protein DUF1232 [Prolixibacter denitrificans]
MYGGKAGVKVVYPALLLYYMLNDPEVAFKNKLYLAGALGYFIFPADAIPDFAPLIGFTDDISVLFLALSLLKENIKDKHRELAREKLKEWFKNYSEKELKAIETSF